MAVAYKVLGQVLSTGTISTYDTIGAQVGVGRSWLVSTIAICNQSASAQTYRLAVTSNSWYYYGSWKIFKMFFIFF